MGIIRKEDLHESLAEQLNEHTRAINQLANPNLIINGDFRINQRGIYTGIHNYTYDRWLLWSEKETKISCNGMWATWDAAANSNLIQVVEIPPRSLNNPLHLSFSCYVTNGESLLVTVDGSGHALSSEVLENHTIIKIDGHEGWEWVDLAIPATVNVTGYIKIRMWSETAQAVHLINVKLEIGDRATVFQPRPTSEELLLCKRYCEASGAEHYTIVNNDLTGYTFEVEKRITPTMTFHTDDGIINQLKLWSGQSLCNPDTPDYLPVCIDMTGPTTRGSLCITAAVAEHHIPQGMQYYGYYTADAEIY